LEWSKFRSVCCHQTRDPNPGISKIIPGCSSFFLAWLQSACRSNIQKGMPFVAIFERFLADRISRSWPAITYTVVFTSREKLLEKNECMHTLTQIESVERHSYDVGHQKPLTLTAATVRVQPVRLES